MSTPVCQTVSANTDVLGIGIRINFYSTMLLIAIIPQTPNTNELLNTLYITAGTSGFGLLLTAIIQTALHRLSLFHAIFIMHILFFLGTGVSPLGKCSAFSCPCSSPPTYVGKYHWARSRIAMGVLLQYISVVSFTAWGLYLWVHVKDSDLNRNATTGSNMFSFFLP
ncbi:hypothetical protein BJV77DRAFT_777258 [Russula vinacea]|nr:hypothetical protein BJV77DRAFT_777258 [Russula vinacea]